MNRKIIIQNIAGACLTAVLLSACQDDMADQPESGGNDILEITASVEAAITTRADGTEITEGNYYFTYPTKPSGEYVTSMCSFTKDADTGKGVGRIYPSSSPLEWKDLPSTSLYTFALDNVSDATTEIVGSSSDGYTTLGVKLDGERKEFYRAAIENTNRNDIVWGIAYNVKKDDVVNIEMSHRMSRVSVTVTDNANREVLEGNVTVKLTKIAPYAELFNRVDGKITLPSQIAYEDVVLVDNAKLEREEILDSEGNGTGTYSYKTPNLILPPQSLRTGNDRPRLEITVGEGDERRTYTGILPAGMVSIIGGYGMTLEFRQGYHLELRVSKLSNNLNEPEILFVPALVRIWDDKGDYTVRSEECGVQSTAELEDAIRAYNELDVDAMRKYGLVQFAKKDDFYKKINPVKYTLQLFANVGLPGDDYRFVEGKCELAIDLNGWSIGDFTDGDEALNALKQQ